MKLASARIESSPDDRSRVRLVGEVAYDDRDAAPEQCWFEVPEAWSGDLSTGGDPWLACLLPLAVWRRESLRIALPVDPVLFANVHRIMEIWAGWNSRLRPVAIEADRRPIEAGGSERATAAFFSGGVDSFYTVLRNQETHSVERPPIDFLLSVWGFDIPLESPDEFERLSGRLGAAARALGKDFLGVATNLRRTRFRELEWGRLAHGSALASVGLALERRFRTLYIAGTHSDGPLRPWGSHPETDPLFSTTATRFIHDSPSVHRRKKVELISRSPVAMRTLHVCFRRKSADNCCNCRKCYVTLLTLDILGALPNCTTFSDRSPDLDKVRRIYVRGKAYARLFRDIQARARQSGRDDLADAIGHCLRRSRWMKPLVVSLKWMSTKRILWRVARRWRPRVLANSLE